MTTPEGILDFIAELTWDDLPPQVRRQSKLCLLDLIGVGAGALAQNCRALYATIAPWIWAARCPLCSTGVGPPSLAWRLRAG